MQAEEVAPILFASWVKCASCCFDINIFPIFQIHNVNKFLQLAIEALQSALPENDQGLSAVSQSVLVSGHKIQVFLLRIAG